MARVLLSHGIVRVAQAVGQESLVFSSNFGATVCEPPRTAIAAATLENEPVSRGESR